jgi:two-component sensor histidine kinase
MVQTDHTNPEMPREPAGELGQEHELLVKLETAEDEVARAAQLIARLEGEQAAERRAIMRQRQTIAALRRELLRRETSLAARNGRADGRRLDLELLCTQLQLTNKELKTIHEELEQSNRALHKANAELESRVAERTAQLEKLVGQLSVAVSERDALLEAQRMLAREVDHRVKNSLQMATSLLAMQAASAESASEQRALQQACSRVQAIAHTHGLLYRADGSATVPFQDYLAALCRDLQFSLAPEASAAASISAPRRPRFPPPAPGAGGQRARHQRPEACLSRRSRRPGDGELHAPQARRLAAYRRR